NDPRIVTEAVRAIHDEPITESLPDLAALLDGSATSEKILVRLLRAAQPTEAGIKPTDPIPALYRVLNACFRLGEARHATWIAHVAARTEAPDFLRRETLRMLADWEKPSGRDRVTNLWRPIEPRSAKPAADAYRANLRKLFAGSES